jgi:hypothetical protein
VADVEFVPALGPGETGLILQRHLVASSGPWVIGKSKKADGLFVFPAANLDQPICYVFDSVAQNAVFLAHAWEDQKRLLATVLRYKGIFGELARGIRDSGFTEDPEGNVIYMPSISAALLVQIEEIAKL